MKFSNTDEGAYGIDKVKEMSSSLSFNVPRFMAVATSLKLKLASFFLSFPSSPWHAGILFGAASSGLSQAVITVANAFVDWYSYGAPVTYLLGATHLCCRRIFSTRRRGKFGLYVITWLICSYQNPSPAWGKVGIM